MRRGHWLDQEGRDGRLWTVFTGLTRALVDRLAQQGPRPTMLWVADHLVRIVTGAPMRSVSQIGSNLHVGGQYRRRGYSILQARGITAVVNMREEFAHDVSGATSSRYLLLPTVEDEAPALTQLRGGVAFIAQEIAQGGSVYVHCRSGVARAATMAAAYLISTGLTPDQAWARIRRVRPFIRPTAAQIDSIEAFFAESDLAEEASHP